METRGLVLGILETREGKGSTDMILNFEDITQKDKNLKESTENIKLYFDSLLLNWG